MYVSYCPVQYPALAHRAQYWFLFSHMEAMVVLRVGAGVVTTNIRTYHKLELSIKMGLIFMQIMNLDCNSKKQ